MYKYAELPKSFSGMRLLTLTAAMIGVLVTLQSDHSALATLVGIVTAAKVAL